MSSKPKHKDDVVRSGKYKGMVRSEFHRIIGRLGGLAANKDMPPELRKRINSKAGQTLYLKYGPEHMKRIRKKWWDSLTEEERRQFRKRLAGFAKKGRRRTPN